jgi:uncharacterized protein
LNKRIILAGGSGLIGRTLAEELVPAGYEVIVLSRNPAKVRGVPRGARVEEWDAHTPEGWGPLVDGAFAVVNLAGESIGIPPLPWTASRKKRIRDSRVFAGKALCAAIESAGKKPSVLVQASAVGYYGARGDEIVTEQDAAGNDFLARIALEWEASTAVVDSLGVRRVVVRTGLPLTRRGGVLPFLVLPFRFFVGGPIGSGKQWMPWIHMADQIGAIRFVIEKDAARGAFNLSAPNPLTNAELARAIGHAMHRPAWFQTPAFMMKLVFGELAEVTLLSGQRVVPERLQEAGYRFKFPNADAALGDILNRD